MRPGWRRCCSPPARFAEPDYFQIHQELKRKGVTLQLLWAEYIGSATLADAILDRLLHGAHRLTLKGESMRKTKAPEQQRVDAS